MKLIKSILVSTVLICLIINPAIAQKNFMKDADKAFDSKEYFNAIELYKSAFKKAKKKEDKALILFKTAECYRLINDTKQAETWYAKAIKANYPDPKAILYLADAKKANQKYDEALVEYNNYKAKVPTDPRGENGVKSCEQAQKWKDAPTRYKVENMSQINSKQADFAPAYSDKKYAALIFTSMREGATGGKIDPNFGQTYGDLFETKVDKNGKWSTPINLPTPLNSDYNEASPAINKKATMMFFTRCGVEKNSQTTCQLYMSSKKGNTWDEPKILPFCVDSFTFGHPAISADEQTLLFASNMRGSFGGKDIWMSTYDKKEKKWGNPVNLGASINTDQDEVYPFLHDDGTLYFSSNGHIGMGGWDIYKAEKKGENQWANVTNMLSPINSPSDDFGIIFEGKKERGYLSSNREGSKGSDDIWSFVLPPCLFAIEGVVKDKDTGIPIENAKLTLVGSDGSSAEIKTDKAGFYRFADNGKNRYVNPNTSYVINAQAENYLSSDKVKETTVGVEECPKTFIHEFMLQTAIGEIRFPEVLYDLGKSSLRAESKDSLNFLYQTLTDNPTIVIELAAHTDSRADDKFNEKLSQARAQACVDYLASKGIPKERMVPKGYGERKLLIKDDYIDKLKSKEEKEAAHQKNRRTVFRVLRFDYVNPNAPKAEPPKLKYKVIGEEEGYEDEDSTGTEEEQTPSPGSQPPGTTTQPQDQSAQPQTSPGTSTTGTVPSNVKTPPGQTQTSPQDQSKQKGGQTQDQSKQANTPGGGSKAPKSK